MTDDVRDAASGQDDGGAATPDPGSVPAREPEASPEVEAFAEQTAAGTMPPVAEATDWQDRWLRCEAELQNFRRRAARDRDEGVTRAQDAMLLELIGVLDDLERALAALAAEQAADGWAQGVALTAQRMRDLLARWDVSEMAALGAPFDPAVHEALLEVPAPEGVAPGAVAQVVLKGYRRGERALRAARVVVARAAGQAS